MKVLIVDDAAAIRRRMARLVGELAGVDTVLQSSGREGALALLAQERPDVVLLDPLLAEGHGMDLLRRIGQLACKPRVIVTASWCGPGMQARCLEAGAECFFEKGAQVLEALDAVRHMAEEHDAERNMDQGQEQGGCGGGDGVGAGAGAGAVVPADGPAPRADAAGRLTVLVVEDDAFARKALVRQLRGLGADAVIEAGDGVQALAVLRERDNAVQLILCDLDLPRMDGLEFMRHLGSLRSPASLVITSAADPGLLNSVQMMCRAYGMLPLGVLPKPVPLERLRALVARAREPLAEQAARAAAGGPEFTLAQILEGLRLDQFEPFFQPKVELSSGRIVGAEALVRWSHPRHGLVAPHAFIGILERGGHIDSLTFMVLEKAARACQRWNSAGHDLTVSVNLSLLSLADTRLAERVCAVVRASGLAPTRLTLEVTETAAMTDVGSALENLARLRLRGFGLSIDDFGTGFASMQQLARVAFSELKIDRGFVSAMADTREARAIVESSIDMTRRLGITAVAEGIETEAEWQALRAAGCTLAQGFLVSPPVPECAFLALCARPAAAGLGLGGTGDYPLPESALPA